MKTIDIYLGVVVHPSTGEVEAGRSASKARVDYIE